METPIIDRDDPALYFAPRKHKFIAPRNKIKKWIDYYYAIFLLLNVTCVWFVFF